VLPPKNGSCIQSDNVLSISFAKLGMFDDTKRCMVGLYHTASKKFHEDGKGFIIGYYISKFSGHHMNNMNIKVLVVFFFLFSKKIICSNSLIQDTAMIETIFVLQ